MSLYLELKDDETRIAHVGVKGSRWARGARGQGVFTLLSRIIGRLGGRAVSFIAVGTDDPSLGTASWSTVRKAVNIANALGFAWGKKVTTLPMKEGESPEDTAERLRRMDEAGMKDWVPPVYGGEPNITKAKKII